MEDPIRLVVNGDALFARIETKGMSNGTTTFSIMNNTWLHISFVKEGEDLRHYFNGELSSSARIPAVVFTDEKTLASA